MPRRSRPQSAGSSKPSFAKGRGGFKAKGSAPRGNLKGKPKGYAPRPSGLPARAPDPEDATEGSGDEDADAGQRLQKFMAAAGVGSRRHCEELIQAGRVEVDGDTVTKLGTRVTPDQKVYVDGTMLKIGRKVYYLVNKPVGVVTTNFDPSGRQRVIDLLPATQERLFAVGRLDRVSEGLILVTNDGELAQRLTHPKFGIQKTYRVQVAGSLDREAAARLVRGVHLAEGVARADAVQIKASQKNSTWVEMILSEGKNREVRRLLAKVGHKVLSLRRIAVGPLKLRDLAPGEFRQLSSMEVKQLWHEALTARKKRKRLIPAATNPDGTPVAVAAASGPKPPRVGKPQAPKRGPQPDEDDFDNEEMIPGVDYGDEDELIAPTGGRSAADDVLIADDVVIGGRHLSGGPAPTILGAEDDIKMDEDDDSELPFSDSAEDDEDDDIDLELDEEPKGPKLGVRGPRVLRPKGTPPGKRTPQRQMPAGGARPPKGKGTGKGRKGPGKGAGRGPGGGPGKGAGRTTTKGPGAAAGAAGPSSPGKGRRGPKKGKGKASPFGGAAKGRPVKRKVKARRGKGRK